MKRRPGKSGSALSLLKSESTRISGHLVGQLLASESSELRVTFPNNPHGPLLARSVVALPASAAVQALPVLLVFEEERSDLPIIVGVLQDATAASRVAPPVATVDGKRVVLTAEDEIVLRCGKASITLRRNGRVVIRGAYVETRAEGVNRVKGGSVQIN
jgi:Domain of unknown function (DUF6484)